MDIPKLFIFIPTNLVKTRNIFMGDFFSSLKRQVGRDTGKVISNSIFGDAHSTPHRNVNRKKILLHQKALEFQHADVDKKDLYQVDSAVINAVDQVISLEITTEKEIISVSQTLEIQLRVNKWIPIHKGDLALIRNKYPDAVLKKYEQCTIELSFLNPEHHRLDLMQKTLKKYRRISFFQKYILYLFVIVALITTVGIVFSV